MDDEPERLTEAEATWARDALPRWRHDAERLPEGSLLRDAIMIGLLQTVAAYDGDGALVTGTIEQRERAAFEAGAASQLFFLDMLPAESLFRQHVTNELARWRTYFTGSRAERARLLRERVR